MSANFQVFADIEIDIEKEIEIDIVILIEIEIEKEIDILIEIETDIARYARAGFYERRKFLSFSFFAASPLPVGQGRSPPLPAERQGRKRISRCSGSGCPRTSWTPPECPR